MKATPPLDKWHRQATRVTCLQSCGRRSWQRTTRLSSVPPLRLREIQIPKPESPAWDTLAEAREHVHDSVFFAHAGHRKNVLAGGHRRGGRSRARRERKRGRRLAAALAGEPTIVNARIPEAGEPNG